MSQSSQVTYAWSVSYVQTDLAKFKGLLIKIKVIKGFSAKLKVLKDCNQIKFLKVLKVPLGGLCLLFFVVC